MLVVVLHFVSELIAVVRNKHDCLCKNELSFLEWVGDRKLFLLKCDEFHSQCVEFDSSIKS